MIVQLKSEPRQRAENQLLELSELVGSAGGTCVGHVMAFIERPSAKSFIAQGKLAEIGAQANTYHANTIIFNVDLSPVQSRNIEAFSGIRVVDRTGLILDIFARRAQSHAGRLQVELAQLNYLMPRLTGQGVIMSRLGGGIGSRGPGEQKLEVDRRKIRERIARLMRELEKLRTHRALLRNHRKRRDFALVAIVGYTNAGKSTLLNTLTGSDVRVEDRLFVTLDPTTRAFPIPGKRQILFTDTVGFLTHLPHTLIEAFHATLEEVTEADVLIHVLDVSSSDAEHQFSAVGKVLSELGAEHCPCVLALNKVDLMDDNAKRRMMEKFPSGFLISAKAKATLSPLIEAVIQKVEEIKGT